LPVVSGAVLFFVTSLGVGIAIGAATVIATAICVAADARGLGNVDAQGRVRDDAGILFFAMCLFWVLAYPFAFFRRRHFGGPHLGPASILVAAFFVVAPIVNALMQSARLPLCTAPEVVDLVEQLAQGSITDAKILSVDGHREVHFDRDADIRYGECVAHTDSGDIPVEFLVEWENREKRMYQVRIPSFDLPLCTDPEVVDLVEQLAQGSITDVKILSLDGHWEVRFDREANIRIGACVAHTDSGAIPVKFLVEWEDREKGLFQVRIPLSELPLCTDSGVVELLEQTARELPGLAELKSLEGHREIRFDRKANIRIGECVAHTDSGERPVKFVVEWQDRETGVYQVRILITDLPLCTDSSVLKTLEQTVRGLAFVAGLKSLDGHRELRFDREADIRYGECMARTDSGEIPVKFLVEWQDRETGMIYVRVQLG
jgi:hypothetical protein